MNEEHEEMLAEFPVDLSREEYIRFNLRVAEHRSLMRFRKVYAVLGGAIMLLTLFLMVLDFIEKRPFDITLLILLLFVAITVLVLVLGVPNFVRHQTGKHFDKEMLDGKTYFGVVRVFADRMEKQCRGHTAVVPYTDFTAFLEYEDMMVFLNRHGSFVFPARCVTAADADVLRAVSKKTPRERRLLYAKMVGKAETRMEMPLFGNKEAEDARVLVEVRADYTAQEIYEMFLHSNTRAYTRWLPLFSAASLVVGVVLGFDGGPLWMAGLFVAFFLFFAAVNLWLPRARMRARMRVARAPEALFIFRFTENGMMVSANGGADFVTYPWTVLVRAVERPAWLEFHTNSSVFEVPKRCVTDIERLREVVNTYHAPR